MSVVQPGGSIGILGGGQLGRMMALAARSLGYGIQVLDPDPACPARAVADRSVTAAFDDADAAAALAAECDVVTIEIEQISLASMRAAAAHAPVRPDAQVLGIVQDRIAQKQWLEKNGFPVGPYRVARSHDELVEGVWSLASACIAKAARGGYDGRSQIGVEGLEDAPAAWTALGERVCVVEQRLELERELSVMVARRPGGETAVYPPAANVHTKGILDWSVIPGSIPIDLGKRAQELGCEIAERLGVEGLLAVELFHTTAGELLVNELAPRPHNTFHHTEVACLTSQFEQAVRTICDLPLGSVQLLQPVALVNLFGDLWLHSTPPFEAALRIPGVKLYLYGKQVPRPARKMGHLCAAAATAEEAVALARSARELLADGSRRPD
jgi:5-(carboxyamino)imidazole ribonucleotide synthase